MYFYNFTRIPETVQLLPEGGHGDIIQFVEDNVVFRPEDTDGTRITFCEVFAAGPVDPPAEGGGVGAYGEGPPRRGCDEAAS